MVNVEGKKGVTDLVRAAVSAAAHAGEDGLGKGALVGYCRRLARAEPQRYFALLVRAMRDQKIEESKRLEKRDERDEWLGATQRFSARAKTTDLLEAIILAATQVGEDGLGKAGVVGYFRRFARAEPKLFASLLAGVMPYRSLCIEQPQLPAQTREELEKELRDEGIEVLFHGDEEDEKGHPFNDGGPWPRIRNIHTGEEFDFYTEAPIPNRTTSTRRRRRRVVDHDS